LAKISHAQTYRVIHGYDMLNSIYERGVTMQLLLNHVTVRTTPSTASSTGRGLVDDRGLRLTSPRRVHREMAQVWLSPRPG
jgi:hypothetical protein